MKNGIAGFKSKDFGAIIYRALSYCLLVCGILLLIQKNLASDIVLLGVKILTLISGLALFACFISNARSRFRPGWTLPMAFVISAVGAVYIVVPLLFPSFNPSIGGSSVVMLVSAVNAVLLLSSGIQLKGLCLNRWIILIILSILNLVFCTFIFFNLIELRSNEFTCFGIFFIMFAVQCFLEGIYHLWKI